MTREAPIQAGGGRFDGRRGGEARPADEDAKHLATETAWRRNEELLEIAQQISHIGVWEWDVASQKAFWTAETYRLHDLDPDQALPCGQKYIDLSLACYAEPDRPAVLAAFWRCVKTGEPYELDSRFTTTKGQKLWIRTTARAVRQHRQVVRVIGTIQDITERKAVEDQLRRNQFLLTEAERLGDVGGWEWDLDTNILTVTDQFMRIHGIRQARLTPTEAKALIHPQDYPATLAVFHNMWDRPGPHQARYRIVRPETDEIRWVYSLWELRQDESGRSNRVMGAAHDITEAVRAQEALRKSEQKFRTLVENANDVVYSLALDRTFAYISPNAVDQTGYEPSELLGQPYASVIHPDDLPACEEFFDRLVSTNRRQSGVEYRLKHKNGSWRWHTFNASATRDHHGNVTSYVGISHDITDRKQAEQTHYADMLERGAILNAQPQLVILQDLNLRILWLNDAACDTAGTPREELIGLPCHQVWMNSPTPCANCPVRQAVRDGQMREAVLTTPNGRTWRVRGCPIRNSAGDIVRMVEVAEDITPQRQIEEQLRQSQKMEALGHLAGGMAHDFRNQLQVIIGFSEVLREQGLVKEPGRKQVEQILAAANRSARLTGQLLAFSRQEMLLPEVIDPAEPIRDLLRSLPSMIGEDIRLSIRFAHRRCHIDMDAGQFQQALVNLALNARDAMPHGGELLIATESVDLDEEFLASYGGAPPGGYAMVLVSDTGVGMDSETRRQIFDPFFTTKEIGKGTGLGLSMVYGFVKQSHGIIICDSAPDQGTVFRMYFPAVEPPPAKAEVPERPAELPAGGGTVLLVEDEDAVRCLMALALEKAGYTVVQAPDPDKALAIAREHVAELAALVTDVVLPGRNGVTLAKEITNLQPGLPVLYVSGYIGEELTRRGLTHIQGPILHKPFTPRQLLERLAMLLPKAPDH